MSRGVVMVSPNFPPYVGGAERQALELSKALLGLGLEVTVLTRRTGLLPETDTVEGVAVRRLNVVGTGLLDSVSFMARVFLWLMARPGRWAAAHVHLAGSPALAAAAAGRLLGRRVVVKLGGGRGIGEIAASARTRAGRLKLRLLAWLKPGLVAVTRDLVDELAEHGLAGLPVTVVPNGVDLERFSPLPPGERSALRKELGWPDGPCLLYVGRLSPEKRLADFIRVFGDAARGSRRPCAFFLAGEGPERERLESVISSWGLAGRVKLLGEVQDALPYYRAADVFVLPSVSEGLSNALLEAMSCGLAVLASRVGGAREAVPEDEAGLLFHPDRAQEAAAGLKRLLEEPGLAAKLGARAREAAAAGFDIKAVAKRYKDLYGL